MGRGTFEKVLTFGGWPFSKPVIVLSSRLTLLPRELPRSVETMAGTPAEVVAGLAARGFKHAYVDGGVTITRFLEAGLIQRLIITRIPVLIGSGIPLFGPLTHDIRLRHVETRTYHRSGLSQGEYVVEPG
jgi:dihydrofolate reductase